MSSTDPLTPAATPTPPRTTEPTHTNAYRLLYRGALSLPDSHILLDGLTFAARLDSPSKHTQLLQNPLALALESMRGRPSLRFRGVVKLDDDNLWLDESGGIEMDIHPRATLTRIYFENVFCLTPFASSSKSTSAIPDASDVGIKVALGDTDEPDTIEIVISARFFTPGTDSGLLSLVVARVASRPPHQAPAPRLPRPDDPTPRVPPSFFGSNGVVAGRALRRMPSTGPVIPGRELKRAASVSNMAVKRPKLTTTGTGTGSILSDLGSGVRLGDGKRGKKVLDAIFKVPDIPLQTTKGGKGKAKQTEGEGDMFGGIEMGMNVGVVNGRVENKGKRKRDASECEIGDDEEVVEMERANKNVIKKCALEHLSNPKDPSVAGIDKSHPEFKDLFGWIYRGVGFALRAQMKIQPVDVTLVDRLVRAHVAMYAGGQGGTYSTSDPISRPGDVLS